LHITLYLTIWICFINCSIFAYSYFPHVLLLHFLYIHVETLKYIKYIITCNIVPYSYFLYVLSLHILYIQLQTVKWINWIINCNIVAYSYFPHVLSLHILYIQLQTLKCITVLLTVILYYIHISLMFCHYINCIYSYRLWNVLTVFLTVILSHIHISLMFCHCISCINTPTKFGNVNAQYPSLRPTLTSVNSAQYTG